MPLFETISSLFMHGGLPRVSWINTGSVSDSDALHTNYRRRCSQSRRFSPRRRSGCCSRNRRRFSPHRRSASRRRYPLQVVPVSEQRLYQINRRAANIVNAGTTNNPCRRAAEKFVNDGFRGTMYVARTSNRMATEDRLLQERDHPCNTHKNSNSQPESGFGYAIQAN